MTGTAAEVAPHVYKTVLENDRVRVLEVSIEPGDKTDMHSHPGMVVYALNSGKWKFTHADGQSAELETTPGQVLWLDAVEHVTENVGDTEGRALLVELK